MKVSHLLAAAVGAIAVFVFAKNPKLRNDEKKSDAEIQKEYESHTNPRETLSSGNSNLSQSQSGSGFGNGVPKSDQTSDWYGNQPQT